MRWICTTPDQGCEALLHASVVDATGATLGKVVWAPGELDKLREQIQSTVDSLDPILKGCPAVATRMPEWNALKARIKEWKEKTYIGELSLWPALTTTTVASAYHIGLSFAAALDTWEQIAQQTCGKKPPAPPWNPSSDPNGETSWTPWILFGSVSALLLGLLALVGPALTQGARAQVLERVTPKKEPA
jgi:hypothetical protein